MWKKIIEKVKKNDFRKVIFEPNQETTKITPCIISTEWTQFVELTEHTKKRHNNPSVWLLKIAENVFTLFLSFEFG